MTEDAKTTAMAKPAVALGPTAVAMAVVGATAVGAFAVGVLTIGRLVVGSGRFRRLQIDELVIGRLILRDEDEDEA